MGLVYLSLQALPLPWADWSVSGTDLSSLMLQLELCITWISHGFDDCKNRPVNTEMRMPFCSHPNLQSTTIPCTAQYST